MKRDDSSGVLNQLLRLLEWLSEPAQTSIPARTHPRRSGTPDGREPVAQPSPAHQCSSTVQGPNLLKGPSKPVISAAALPRAQDGLATVSEIAWSGSAQYQQATADQLSGMLQYGRFEGPAKDHPLISIGYRRCRDFDQSNSPGQDFATVRADSKDVVGIVADGVSQSFLGNIAAKFLGTELLEVL